MNIFIKHPRSKKPDAMLTFSLWTVLVVLGKVLLNGIFITVLDYTLNFGTIDAALAAAVLTATLGAYVGRKWKNPPETNDNNVDNPDK